jgi:hypothetical protein
LSTETTRRRPVATALALALLLGACHSRPSYKLTDLCGGATGVTQRLTLVIDSAHPAAGASARGLVGKKYDLTLNLFNLLNPPRCEDRDGEASLSGYLPDFLSHAVSTRKQVPRWSIEGPDVAVQLNPGVLDDNLSFTLPLDGRDGRWGLSTLAGEVASGRLLVQHGEGR